MKVRPVTGLTFDDVLLVPRRSSIRSRRDASTRTRLTPEISLEIPLVSANMDTVTETRMGIAMAHQGGIGILHRFMSIEQQAEMVERVKHSENLVVEEPLSIPAGSTIESARQLMADEGVGGLMVIDSSGVLLGMVTTRDVLLAEKGSDLVETVMTPRSRLIVADQNESMQSARLKLHEHRIEKLPLVDHDNHVVGLITVQDIVKIQEHPLATKDSRGRLLVGVAVGVRADDMERAAACVDAGADTIVVDIAHGHSEHTLKMVTQLKKKFHVPIIAGNVATPEGVRDLADAGADAVKVGVGAGSICITRIVTGFGVPQLTAILDCAEMGQRMRVPIIADGGVRNSGDLVKALAAGASTVMLGSMLAGTDESPGAPVVRDGRRYKVVRGMASLSANIQRMEIDKGEVSDEDWGDIVAEGVEAMVPARGGVTEILHQLVGGLRSGLSYAGAACIEDLWSKAEFIPITQAGMRESGPHDVNKI